MGMGRSRSPRHNETWAFMIDSSSELHSAPMPMPIWQRTGLGEVTRFNQLGNRFQVGRTRGWGGLH